MLRSIAPNFTSILARTALIAACPLAFAGQAEAALPYENVLLDEADPAIADIRAYKGVRLDQAEIAPAAMRIPDPELGMMRGKFISPDAVSYFGISMLTSWQDEQGITTAAQLAFTVDFMNGEGSGTGAPQLMVGWVRDGGDPAMDVAGVPDGYVAIIGNAGQVMPVGALDTLRGAGQANLIAGADNSSRNSLQFMVVPHDGVPDMTAGDLQPINATTSHSFDDGDQLQFRLGSNEIGLVLTGNNGLDSTMQTAGGDLGRMLQQTVLNSDSNNVLNSTAITFGVDTLQNFEQVRADGALMTMKGFGF